MPAVEHRPKQISSEWRLHRRLAKRYHLPLRVRLPMLFFAPVVLALSAGILVRLTGMLHNTPLTLLDYLVGPVFALAFLVMGVTGAGAFIYTPYLVSPVGFEFRVFPYATFAPWENITVVTGMRYAGDEVIALELRPPQFEITGSPATYAGICRLEMRQ